ncbi:MAG: alpha/beta hydrolase [Actinomycetia bacterium]|nr:alpha/beta hydrolase [Actinomycetes bacterium]
MIDLAWSVVDSILLLLLGMWAATATFNALYPFRQTALLFPSMFWSWFVIGLPGQLVFFQMLTAGFLIWRGALEHPVGWIGLILLIISWLGTVLILARTRKSGDVVDAALSQADVTRSGPRVPVWRVLLSAPFRGRTVEKIRNVPFRRVAGHTVKLDVYRDKTDRTDRPVFMYIHGGGWVMGDKREQGIPLLHHMARAGWLGFSVNYRLSPGVALPDQLADVKAGLAWIREHAAEYGGDPSFVAVSGGSAGGNLAALVGLTENDPRYQPGFEDADTSVQITAPVYGIYDVSNRMGVQTPRFVPMLMEPLVIKAFLDDEPEKFAEMSPLDRIHSDVPPFVIAQGDRDSLAPVVEARAFVEQLENTSQKRVVYMEFPGAQHIFDLGYSYQSAQMIEGVLAVLNDEYQRFEDLPRDGSY